MELQDRINKLIEDGHEAKLHPIVDQLEKVVTLPEALQTKLNALGNTPVAEPVLYEAITKSGEEGLLSVALNALSEDEIIAHSAEDIGLFVSALTTRITALKDEDGTYKTTPSTEGCKQPNFIECDQIRRLGVAQADVVKKWTETKSDKTKEKALKDFEKATHTLADKAIAISGLDVSLLTEWEKALVSSQVIETATNAFKSATGKR
jgi:hypothetical protein